MLRRSMINRRTLLLLAIWRRRAPWAHLRSQSSITPESPSSLVTYLSSDQLEAARRSPKDSAWRVRYIAEQLKEAGR